MVRNLSPISEKLLSELKKKYWNDKAKLLECIKRQYEIDQRYLRMARIWSENSYCVRRKVGALLVKIEPSYLMVTMEHLQGFLMFVNMFHHLDHMMSAMNKLLDELLKLE